MKKKYENYSKNLITLPIVLIEKLLRQRQVQWTKQNLYIQVKGKMMSLKLRSYLRRMRMIQPGETIRVSHYDLCEAGHDNRRRLYLTRTLADPCVIIGFCHNCQQGGKISDKGFALYRDRTHEEKARTMSTTTSNNVLSTLSKGLKDLELWPHYARAWAIKGKLNQEALLEYQIRFLVSEDRILLPMFTQITMAPVNGSCDYGRLFGFQTRSVNGQAPKYYTAIDKDSAGFTLLKRTKNYNDRVTIVEDYVSGINIMRANADTDVIVNYGVKVNPHVVKTAANYKQALIWLDNDSEFINGQSQIYGRTISLFNGGTDVGRITAYKDPKKYQASEILHAIGSK